ncbi:signal peptidase I [Campylobacter sp. 19-13652]|uniref:signal peptidase I n=1 Tax=Campylobacter sp. 19-13652 TaxID=2840180 RepID=UPI001C76ABD8|nr:signal peptidase I [Campylobacter sp. 19-13652]BCX79105.1 signal peptidase I [Campylobacter sp. 19-13652]
MIKFLSRLNKFSNSWTGTVIIVLFLIFFVAQAFVIPSGSMKNTLLIGDHLFVKKFSYGIPTPTIPFINKKILPDFFGNGHLIEGDKPQRGDIVVFLNVLNESEHYVKRLFGVGDDEIVFDGNAMYLRPHEGDEFISQNYKKEDIISLDGRLFVREPYKFSGIHYDKNVDMFSYMIYALNSGKLDMKPVMINSLEKRGELPFNAFYTKVKANEFYMIGDNRDHSNDSRFWGSVPYRNIIGKPWFIYLSWDDKYRIRWERIGRLVSTIENSDEFTQMAIKEEEVDGVY